MRKMAVSLVMVIAVVLFSVAGVSAHGSPPPALSSGFQLQNRSTTAAATVQIAFYNGAGTVVQTLDRSIAQNASASYYVPNVLSQPDGRYSVVVSSDQELFALVNTVTASGASPNVAATHSGFAGGDVGAPLYLPWVVCDYYDYNSMFAIQNAGSAATAITVRFFQSGQSTATRTYNFAAVAPGSSVYLDMTAAPYATDLHGFFGAVVIESTGNTTPLAAVLSDTNPAGSFLRSYNAVLSGSTKLFAPQVTANYYGFSSGITLQNPTGIAATLVISYYVSGQTTPVVVQNTSVAANSAKPIYLPNVTGMPTNFNGTAVIQSSQPIMGVTNHDHVPSGPAAAYNLIPLEKASQTLYMPQVVRAYYGFESGWQAYNIGPDSVSIQVSYFNADGTARAVMNHTVAAGAAFTMYLGDSRGAALGTNFNGGGVIKVLSGNGALVGIANFVSPNGGDYQQVYNAFTP